MIALAIAISLRRVSDREAKYLKEDRCRNSFCLSTLSATTIRFIVSSTIISSFLLLLSELASFNYQRERKSKSDETPRRLKVAKNIDHRGDVDLSRLKNSRVRICRIGLYLSDSLSTTTGWYVWKLVGGGLCTYVTSCIVFPLVKIFRLLRAV